MAFIYKLELEDRTPAPLADARPSLGPSSEIDDEHDEQNDDQKANQSVTGSSNGERAEHGASFEIRC